MNTKIYGVPDDILKNFVSTFRKQITPEEAQVVKRNLYGFAKALIKAKLETDGNLYASKGRKIQNNS